MKIFRWIGTFLATLTILSVSCSTSTISFKIEPTSHDFGQVNISETATFDFVVSNKKSVDMTLTIVNFSTGEFSETTGAQGKTIVAKGTLTITVQFAPALPDGAKTDTMHVEWTDINGKTGKKDIILNGEAVPVPKISTPSTYDFGTVGIGNTASHDFDIENTGTASLVLSLFNFNGNATLFSITAGGTVPVTVNPGVTHTVTVQYSPTATGSFPTVLEITHNAVNATPPAEITISAAAGGGRIVLNQTSPWDFGTVSTGGSSSDVVEISNTGSIDLNISNISLSTGTIFTIDACDDSSGNPITAPFAISPADFVEVCIKFSPTTAGNFNDTLNISHDGSYSVSPASLNLEGVGRTPVVRTFSYTGSPQNWNVPAGTTSLTATALGAQGGTASGSTGGKGGRAIATIAVNPGETLGFYVGGQGFRIVSSRSGGYNGGGGVNAIGSGYAGTGGGASDVRRGTTLQDRLIVAGGGGGGGWEAQRLRGGYGGGLTGGDGPDRNPYWAHAHGKGGTQTAGGAAGYYNSNYASPGTLGLGGTGRGDNAGGGGGGGGYYGGGGGFFTGAGGGSSYIDASGNTNKSTTQDVNTGNGSIRIQY